MPLALLLPDQAPLAMQVVPEFDDHLMVALWPTVTVVGATLILMLAAAIGAGGAMLAMYPIPPEPPHAPSSTAMA